MTIARPDPTLLLLGTLTNKIDSGTATAYDYDTRGSLQSIRIGTNVIDYLLDPYGRRIGKTVNGTTTRKWIYQDFLKPVAELDGDGALISRFVYATRVNAPDYMVRSGKTYRIVSDHLGSVRLVVDTADGSIAQRIDYDEWGRVLSDTNPGFQPFGFAGGVYDADSGLIRFGYRDYDSLTGRWQIKDPILFGGGVPNLYQYCRNEPTNLRDPMGLLTIQVGGQGSGGGGVGGNVGGGWTCSISWSHGIQVGAYTYAGGGSYVGSGGSLGAEFAVSGNSSIMDLDGETVEFGGSGSTPPAGVGAGGAVNVPTPGSGSIAKPVYSVNLGVSGGAVPGEGHMFVNKTKVTPIFSIPNPFAPSSPPPPSSPPAGSSCTPPPASSK